MLPSPNAWNIFVQIKFFHLCLPTERFQGLLPLKCSEWRHTLLYCLCRLLLPEETEAPFTHARLLKHLQETPVEILLVRAFPVSSSVVRWMLLPRNNTKRNPFVTPHTITAQLHSGGVKDIYRTQHLDQRKKRNTGWWSHNVYQTKQTHFIYTTTHWTHTTDTILHLQPYS